VISGLLNFSDFKFFIAVYSFFRLDYFHCQTGN